MFLTKGIGKHKDKLRSFELALRDAAIAKYNLVRVSSILPPECKIVSKEEGLKDLKPGQIVHCVLSQNSNNEPLRLLGASIGVAIPADREQYGYLSEYHSFAQAENDVGDYAEDLAASMLATILGIEFDDDVKWDEKKEVWKMSGKIVKTSNVTQSGVVDETGEWTTVLAGAVFIL